MEHVVSKLFQRQKLLSLLTLVVTSPFSSQRIWWTPIMLDSSWFSPWQGWWVSCWQQKQWNWAPKIQSYMCGGNSSLLLFEIKPLHWNSAMCSTTNVGYSNLSKLSEQSYVYPFKNWSYDMQWKGITVTMFVKTAVLPFHGSERSCHSSHFRSFHSN